jgi:predicted MFS family arabinose efflux permease
MGFFGAAATALPYSVAIAGWFDRNRGLALALVVGGTGVSAMFISRYAYWLLTNFGWRGGYIGIAIFCAAVALPGLAFLFSMPPSAPGPRLAACWRPILANANLWFMTIPLFCISVAVYGVTTNMAPLFTDRGMSMVSAATLLGVLGGTSGISRIVTGAIMDRIHVRFVSAAVFLLVGCGIVLVAYGHNGGLSTTVGVVAIGVGLGAEAGIMGFAVSYYFGAESLPRAGGVVFAACAWGGGVGNALGSISYDLTNSYDVALVAYICLAILSAAVILKLGPYKSTVIPEPLSPLPST